MVFYWFYFSWCMFVKITVDHIRFGEQSKLDTLNCTSESHTYFPIGTGINAFPLAHGNSRTYFFHIAIFLSVLRTALLKLSSILQRQGILWYRAWLPYFKAVEGISVGSHLITVTAALCKILDKVKQVFELSSTMGLYGLVLRSFDLNLDLNLLDYVWLPSVVFHTWYDIQTLSNVG